MKYEISNLVSNHKYTEWEIQHHNPFGNIGRGKKKQRRSCYIIDDQPINLFKAYQRGLSMKPHAFNLEQNPETTQCFVNAIILDFDDLTEQECKFVKAVVNGKYNLMPEGKQIYGDYSVYSDMAMGSAKLLSIRISANFDKPYFATSLPEFWRRWHITLMGWFRDYVYIPLGGNRLGPARQTANRFAVFLLSGLWHGSNWTFVLWGLYHALCYRLPARRLTFFVVLLGWVIFRAEDATMAAGYLSGMFCPRMLSSVACSRMPLLPIALLVVSFW